MKPRISMITLGVRDFATSVKFYEEGLGFPRMESPPDVAFFTLNGTWLGLYGRKALAEDATVSAEGHGFESLWRTTFHPRRRLTRSSIKPLLPEPHW